MRCREARTRANYFPLNRNWETVSGEDGVERYSSERWAGSVPGPPVRGNRGGVSERAPYFPARLVRDPPGERLGGADILTFQPKVRVRRNGKELCDMSYLFFQLKGMAVLLRGIIGL
jgi:hypothetical protein